MSEIQIHERIEDVDVSKEMESSFLEYAYSVIYSRALPDARDGLKPVQRRILFMMTQMGLTPEKGHVKSARVVGEVMGKLHPHGDSSIYDALVRLAQGFTMRLPMVDGHGNFGSLDDGPAASRYTEARLTGAAIAMTEGLKEDVVDFVPNYDNQIMQPEVLPALIPNLLVNGASGIAVGMATNLAPHNLVEVIEAATHLLFNPDASIEELMQFVPGPDLPGGGTIVGLEGIKDAYETGRGQFKTRAKVTVEKVTARKTGLVVTELPYLVGPERIIEKIKQGVEAKKISGISDVEDLTGHKTGGTRMVITLKTGFSPEGVLEQLYRTTPLEDSFSINSVALLNGEPKTMTLKDMLRVFLDHRILTVTRRSKFRLAKRKERLHLVEGLLVAIVDIDAVIQIIRASDDGEQAKSRLIEAFDFSDLQAEYILELRLRRLTKFSRVELESERDLLRREIDELNLILNDRDVLYKLIASELSETAEKYGTPRRTLLLGAVERKTRAKEVASLQVADEPCTVLLSTSGKLLRAPRVEGPNSYKIKNSALQTTVETTTRADLQAVLSNGMAVRFNAVELPEAPAASISFKGGVDALSYLNISENNVKIVSIAAFDAEKPLGLITANGVVKRTIADDLASKDTWELISLKPGDSVIAAMVADDDAEFIFITNEAQLLRFSASLVRPQGKNAGGMAGIALKDGGKVIYGNAVADSEALKVVTVATSENALPGVDLPTVKISDFTDFPSKGRATGGVRAHRFLKGESTLQVAWVGEAEPIATDNNGDVRQLPTEISRRDASGVFSDGHIESIGYRA